VDHETGSTDDRAEFQSVFKDASQRKFDVLLFWALDRLSREGVLETLQHLSRLTGFGVGYRSFTEQSFDPCGIFKDAVIAIIATVAKQERVRISQRVRAGRDLASAKGRSLGRPRVAVDSLRIALLRGQGRSWIPCAECGSDHLGLCRPPFRVTRLRVFRFGTASITQGCMKVLGKRTIWRHYGVVRKS
jgi:Resolvase, N terminal domain